MWYLRKINTWDFTSKFNISTWICIAWKRSFLFSFHLPVLTWWPFTPRTYTLRTAILDYRYCFPSMAMTWVMGLHWKWKLLPQNQKDKKRMGKRCPSSRRYAPATRASPPRFLLPITLHSLCCLPPPSFLPETSWGKSQVGWRLNR